MTASSQSRKRVLSGMRPTGKLHLGNYVGALQNWVGMQEKYECFFEVADWHALTTDYADTSLVKESSIEAVTDWLAAGLDPEKSVIFIQSHVPAHAELHLLFSMITPLGWLERVPSYKEQQENIKGKDLTTYGFLGYPCLQAADILIYKADVVPVGEDQVAHVELTREIARRFNGLYPRKGVGGFASPTATSEELHQRFYVFPEPQSLLTPAAKLPGTDGRKMSKSYGNTIMLADSEPSVREKLRTMVNDPRRERRADPGDPDVCPVGDLHKIFSDPATVQNVYLGCRSATISCIECKSWAADAIVNLLNPMQERRREFEDNPRRAWEILEDGSARARSVCEATLKEVRSAMRMSLEYDPSLIKPRRDIGATLPIDPSVLDLEGQAFGDAMRDQWIANLPASIVLQDIDRTRTFLTSSRKRVGIASAHEQSPGQWVCKPLDRTTDVLVLLLAREVGEMIPLILPQKILQPNWKKFRREDQLDAGKKGKRVLLPICMVGSDFFLDLPAGEGSVSVTEFRSNLDPLF
jgi:tryptophanyl-tRNA synthetase